MEVLTWHTFENHFERSLTNELIFGGYHTRLKRITYFLVYPFRPTMQS